MHFTILSFSMISSSSWIRLCRKSICSLLAVICFCIPRATLRPEIHIKHIPISSTTVNTKNKTLKNTSNSLSCLKEECYVQGITEVSLYLWNVWHLNRMNSGCYVSCITCSQKNNLDYIVNVLFIFQKTLCPVNQWTETYVIWDHFPILSLSQLNRTKWNNGELQRSDLRNHCYIM